MTFYNCRCHFSMNIRPMMYAINEYGNPMTNRRRIQNVFMPISSAIPPQIPAKILLVFDLLIVFILKVLCLLIIENFLIIF